MPHFDALKIYCCGKHCEKRSNCLLKQFLLYSQCFLPYTVLIFHLKCTLKCRLQFISIWTSLKFCCLVKVKNIQRTIVSSLYKEETIVPTMFLKAFSPTDNSHKPISSLLFAELCHLVKRCLFVGGFMLYPQYFSYSMVTVHKSLFPGLFFNQYLTSPLS